MKLLEIFRRRLDGRAAEPHQADVGVLPLMDEVLADASRDALARLWEPAAAQGQYPFPIMSPDAKVMLPARIAITSEDKVVLAMEHLRAARGLLRDAGAFKALERVQRAVASADGARRHARLEPYRKARQNGGAA
jgi:hypothetical protein